MILRFNSSSRAASSWFANCCGASYPKITDKTKITATQKGFRVFDGAFGQEYEGRKQSVKHIHTKNGTITLSIRHTW